MTELEQIRERLKSLPSEIQEAGEKYAESKAQYEYLEDMKKVRLSKRMIDVNQSMQELGKKPSEWKVRFIAEGLVDKDTKKNKYAEYLNVVRMAREISLKDQAAYVARQAEFESYRSLSALEKAMTKNL